MGIPCLRALEARPAPGAWLLVAPALRPRVWETWRCGGKCGRQKLRARGGASRSRVQQPARQAPPFAGVMYGRYSRLKLSKLLRDSKRSRGPRPPGGSAHQRAPDSLPPHPHVHGASPAPPSPAAPQVHTHTRSYTSAAPITPPSPNVHTKSLGVEPC